MTGDGSEMYISDYHQSVIRQYIVEKYKMVDILTGTFKPGN